MNTLVPDLFRLVDDRLNIVEHILLNESPTNDYINYTTNPKWLLYLIKRGTGSFYIQTGVLFSGNHIDWLKHLVIHSKSVDAFIDLCTISKMSTEKRLELYNLALKNDMINIYDHQVFRASIVNGYLDDFVAHIKDMQVFDPSIFEMVYEHGHQNIIDYMEANCSYVMNNNLSEVVSGMIKCKNRTYNRDLIKTMIINIINGGRFGAYMKFLRLCSMYINDFDWIVSVFRTRCYRELDFEMLDSALSTNNSVVVDRLMNSSLKLDKLRHLDLYIKHNSITNIHKILKSLTEPPMIIFNITIETINLIFPYLSTKPTVDDLLMKFKYTSGYVLFCHLMQLI